MTPVIQVKDLFRHFKEIKAVDGLSFTVHSGQVYGFLGQNGAGKSTTIRMLLTLVQPGSGEIDMFGLNLKKHRREILKQTGAIIERPDLYKYLTARENLRIFSRFSGTKVSDRKIMEQLALVGLTERADSKVKTFSQGMKQRLGIAVALIHDPLLVILDEPTNGLDPQGIADVRRIIRHLSRDLGKTVLISSHLLNEIELVADSMLIIDRGKKVVEGTMQELLQSTRMQIELMTDDQEKAFSFIRETKWADSIVESSNNNILLQLDQSQMPELNRALVEKGVSLFSLRPRHSLEDIFLSLTRH